MPVLKSNERSEAIELIKESQLIFSKNDFVFKQASGEQSLSKNGNNDKRANTLFPDVIYYADSYQLQIALGWELKMPDTDIYDRELFDNAVDKANRLNTNVFVLWNFKETIVYYREENDNWKLSKSWHDLITNNTRDDVIKNRDKWKRHLEDVIVHLNTLFREEIVVPTPVLTSVENLAQNISETYSLELSTYYKNLGDRVFLVNIKRWYEEELLEFSSEDPDKVSDEEKLEMYAKSTLLSWVNRITFANLLKSSHNSVYKALSKLINEESFESILESFNNATTVADFYTILHCDDNEIILSDVSKSVIREYAIFLMGKDFESVEQDEFRATLENIIDVTKRELMGLFTTPKKLAKFLVESTMTNIRAKVIDPCVGSGTIASSVMELVSDSVGVEYAHEHIWASDKYKLPLQVANISLSTKDSLNLANIVFQNGLLNQKIGDEIYITDPQTGELKKYILPEFDYVLSNLPFIRSERLKNDLFEKEKQNEINDYLQSKDISSLNQKNDWYQFGIVGIERILKEGGKLAVITSNSWLKTKSKKNYIETLFELFDVNKVIISGTKKWFDNADVVSVILIATKTSNENRNNNIQFIKLLTDVNSMSEIDIAELSEAILLDEVENPNIEVSCYSKADIHNIIKSGLSLNVLFNDLRWFDSIKDITIPMTSVFEGKRGVKSTNDKFFYDIHDSEQIEAEYLLPLLKTIRNVKGYFAEADSNAFVVRETLDQLENEGKIGSVQYIQKHANETKNVSQSELDYWYQLPDIVTGDFVTSLNPDRRIFWSRVSENLLINQRLTVFKVIDENADKDFIHALLNTYFGQFMIEATGFGRGLGVLDTTKAGILDSLMIDYRLFNLKDIQDILNSWRILSEKEVPDILEQLEDEDWYQFNELVFKKLSKEHVLPELVETFKKSIKMRSSSRS